MVESVSKMLWANFFLKKEFFIEVLVLTLHNKMVWLKDKQTFIGRSSSITFYQSRTEISLG